MPLLLGLQGVMQVLVLEPLRCSHLLSGSSSSSTSRGSSSSHRRHRHTRSISRRSRSSPAGPV